MSGNKDGAGLGFLDAQSGDGEGQGRSTATSGRRVIALTVVLLVMGAGGLFFWHKQVSWHPPHPAEVALPSVTVSTPLVREVTARMKFLGQFSAVDRVEFRAQVGGILSQILFSDGQIVRKGDLLFAIDTRPYEIKLREATAALQSDQAQLALSNVELWRAQQLKKTSFGTAETVDQRQAEQQAAATSVRSATQAVMDAQLDLNYCHVTAPFTGRMSNHFVSVGNLVSGSRAGSSPTTLLATIVSIDPIYLDFDMSENEFVTYQNGRRGRRPDDRVSLHVDDEARTYRGTFDFIDNAINRSSGTIHARATVPNADLSLVPGEFAELEITLGVPAKAFLVPDSAVSLDQSEHFVMTVAADGTVTPKQVSLDGLFEGLRIVRAGLKPTDMVIIDGLVRARPGAKVSPERGSISLMPSDAQD